MDKQNSEIYQKQNHICQIKNAFYLAAKMDKTNQITGFGNIRQDINAGCLGKSHKTHKMMKGCLLWV
jgi:hypothetical protein